MEISIIDSQHIFKRYYLFIFRQGKEGEGERNISVWLPLAGPLLGTWPTTQTCALTRNQTSDPLVHRLALNPLCNTSQSHISFLTLRHQSVHRYETLNKGEKQTLGTNEKGLLIHKHPSSSQPSPKSSAANLQDVFVLGKEKYHTRLFWCPQILALG